MTTRIPKIGLKDDYYSDFGIKTIPGQTNDPGFPGVFPSRTNNPLAPVVRMPTPSNEASSNRVRVADNSKTNYVSPEDVGNFDLSISDKDRDYLARIVATEADHRYASSDPDTYNAMVAGIVDTVLNRVASPRFPNTVKAVANQKNQFSAINGPTGRGYTVWKDVAKVPDSIVTDSIRKAVDDWVDQRILGTPSSVGGGLHYANPNFSDEKNKAWIEGLTGPRVGTGVSLHYHGTAPGYRSKEASVTGLVKSANPAFSYDDGLGLTTSSGSFLGLAPLLNQKTVGSNVTRMLIGDIPLVVKKSVAPQGPQGRGSARPRNPAEQAAATVAETPAKAAPKEQPRQTAVLPSGKTVEVGRIYTVGGRDFIAGTNKDGVGTLTQAPKSIVDEASGKSAVGGAVREIAAKETVKTVKGAIEGAAAAAPGIAQGVADKAGELAGGVGKLFGDMFGGAAKTATTKPGVYGPLPAPKPLSFPAIIPALVTKKVATVGVNPDGSPKSGKVSIAKGSGGVAGLASGMRAADSVTYQRILKDTAPTPVKGKSSAIPQPGTTYENLVTEYRLFGGKEPPKSIAPQGPQGRGGKRGAKSLDYTYEPRRRSDSPNADSMSFGDLQAGFGRPVYDAPFDRGVVAPRVPARRPDTLRSPPVPSRRPSYSPVAAPSPAAAPAAPAPTAYQTTQFQQDRFQTTEGATMPSSMNNSRWTTGYA
jgi:hypothetical protein